MLTKDDMVGGIIMGIFMGFLFTIILIVALMFIAIQGDGCEECPEPWQVKYTQKDAK